MSLIARPSSPLHGTAFVPGDKSISHRALMLAALAKDESRITGLLEGADVLATAAALRAMDVKIERDADDCWCVRPPTDGLTEPANVLDMGNAGTAARLLAGVIAGHAMTAILTGDASLRSRPMVRIADPLTQMGAHFLARSGTRLPMAIRGADPVLPIRYETPVASAQVKSAILLAGLKATGETVVTEKAATRDHTERMLAEFGASIRTKTGTDGRPVVTLTGPANLTGREIVVPRDISSAAFLLVAALIVPNSQIVLPGVGVNPGRIGLVLSLREMGADIVLSNEHDSCGEPVADLTVRASRLTGIDVPSARVPSMIDEIPILAVAAACATGTTRLTGLAELKHKESDRLTVMAEGLAACGVHVTAGADTLKINGTGEPPPGGAVVDTCHDHRIAMSFLVLG
ncbi:MAG: 3-phosphoshikimate 1-carboxyvinyltransferase, partial [Pseudomonadota bacterium]|nr:3-phosphoshikimate 1-carboxyvinyltransferase [Pseudomonadota bacterium]